MREFNFNIIQHSIIRGKKEGSHLVILAGVHGDEYEPMAAARRLVSLLPELLSEGSVTIVPILNASAFERASRTGEDGLDLARICPGNKNGSLSERVAAEVSELIASADYLIDLHGGGNLYEIDPLAGYVLHDSLEVLEKQRAMARAFNLKTIWGTSNKLNGRTLSVARDENVPAIYTEYGGGGGFKKEIVDTYVEGCLNVMRMLGMSKGPLGPRKYVYEVEDFREGSGHLQVMLPASADGFFEALAGLGEFVKKEQHIGNISDPFGKDIVPVYADQDGMIFLLRAIPAVKKGETLGGILPVSQHGKVTIV